MEEDRVKALFDAASSGDASRIVELVKGGVPVNSTDETGMTPLMHAAFKGHEDACKALLGLKADPNATSHKNMYTALMFSAMAGATITTLLLLQNGAKANATNDRNKTASMTAAFVGQHECASLINNFFPFSHLEYFTKPQGLETEPKLKPEMGPILHGYVLLNNLNPARVALYLSANPGLLTKNTWRVLDMLVDRSLLNGRNQVMSMKLHYLTRIFEECLKDGGPDKFVKSMLATGDTDPFPYGQEAFIRQAIRTYKFTETDVLEQLVRAIAPVLPGNDPTALACLTSQINGMRSAGSVTAEDKCVACGATGSKLRCSACKSVVYCSRDCQKIHRFAHKKFCFPAAVQPAAPDAAAVPTAAP
eukprot:Opistho-2@50030